MKAVPFVCLLLVEGFLLVPYGETMKQVTYYVLPDFPPHISCPGDPSLCGTLTDLLVHKSFNQVDTITMEFLEGVHSSNNHIRGFEQINVMIWIGKGSTEKVVISHVNVHFLNVAAIHVANVTVKESNLKVRQPIISDSNTSSVTRFTITRCTFTKTTILTQNADLLAKDSTFLSSPSTAIALYASTVTLSGKVEFANNRGIKGGALSLIATPLNIDRGADIHFSKNVAHDRGGAIFVYAPSNPKNCFYQLKDFDTDSYYNVSFSQNSALQGGDHVYGAGMKGNCIAAYIYEQHSTQTGWRSKDNVVVQTERQFHLQLSPDYYSNSSLSVVSGEPSRVCICDGGEPQCGNFSKVLISSKLHPGENITISAVVVGDDFGTTTGNVYAGILPLSSTTAPAFGEANQHTTYVSSKDQCTNLTYSVLSNSIGDVLLSLTATDADNDTILNYYKNMTAIKNYCELYDDTKFIPPYLLSTPVFINIKLLPCPPGFYLSGVSRACDCYPALSHKGAICYLDNKTGYIKWDTNNVMWIGIDDTENNTNSISDHCPPENCNSDRPKIVSLNAPDTQCLPYRTGRLCGKCQDGYSLAIGSSNCIRCPNSDNLALIVFFAGAGVLLVFFIGALNLTVTQGTINGLIFYANILWAYQGILFPKKYNGEALIVLRPFIAWVNLDFGIQTCLFKGLTAFWKTWLQFIFPFYTASLFFLGLRYSTALSKRFGSRSVPTLATILYLSYTKLLRIIITSLQLASVTTYSGAEKESATRSTQVWAPDGNLTYGHQPHIFLLLAALACLISLWMPYTLLLFSMQWLRRIDHYRPLKLISKYKPVYDAYFAPLRDKHQYWFGVLLLAQGVLLTMSSLTLNIFPFYNVFFLFIVVLLLLCYMNYASVYKRRVVSVFESSFLINLALLVSGVMHYEGNNKARSILLQISISITLLEFLGIILMNLIQTISRSMPARQHETSNHIHSDKEEQSVFTPSARFRDSILEEKELLLPTY